MRLFAFQVFILLALSGLPAAAEGGPESSAIPAPTAPAEAPAIEKFPSFESAFQAGVKFYQENKFAESKSAFTQALEFRPDNVSTLTNLALAQFQNGQKGWAVALLRKATNLAPDFSTSKAALDFILPQLEIKEIPHEIRLWETLHAKILAPFPLFFFSLLAAFFVFVAGWSGLAYLGSRRRALASEQLTPKLPLIGFICCLGALAFSLLSGMKIYDQRVQRATVVATKINVLSVPDEKAPGLFELYPGLEVIVDQTQNEWAQVTYPGGLSGWVPKSSIYETNE